MITLQEHTSLIKGKTQNIIMIFKLLLPYLFHPHQTTHQFQHIQQNRLVQQVKLDDFLNFIWPFNI